MQEEQKGNYFEVTLSNFKVLCKGKVITTILQTNMDRICNFKLINGKVKLQTLTLRGLTHIGHSIVLTYRSAEQPERMG